MSTVHWLYLNLCTWSLSDVKVTSSSNVTSQHIQETSRNLFKNENAVIYGEQEKNPSFVCGADSS